MRSARTRCVRIEKRTLSIGFGIKRAPECEERLPEFSAFQPSLSRGHTVPLSPLGIDKVLSVDLPKALQTAFMRDPDDAQIVPLATQHIAAARPAQRPSYAATSSASLAATFAIGSSAVLKPLREPSRGLTSRRAS